VRVLVACSLGGTGHLNPLTPFLAAATRRGDQALVIGPPALQEMVEHAGFPFEAGGAPPEAEVAPIREQLPVAPARQGSTLASRELFGRLATAAMLPAMEQTCAEWAPDLVLRDPCEYASAVVAHRLGIPNAQVAISLAEAEAASISAAAPALEEHRLGLVGELRFSPYLTRFPASLDPSSFPTTVRFHDDGLLARDPGTTLPDWWDGSRAPLVYLTFGTVLGHMSMAPGVYQTAMKAVEHLGVRVLLTVGRQLDRSRLGPVPGNVRVESYVDQTRVLPEASLVVTHGGSGTAFGALAAGVPVVVAPLFADQFENGRRIAEAGAGVLVEPAGPGLGEEDAPRIAKAITSVLATPTYRRQAVQLAAEMTGTRTVDEVLTALLAGAISATR
jgi:UDP:flavonoid glycosyltransferase YjiC (YdhE family)